MSVDLKWFLREQWTLIEAAQICAGIDPYQGGPATDSPHQVAKLIADAEQRQVFTEIYSRSKDAINQNTVAIAENSRTRAIGNIRVKPFDYVVWIFDTRFGDSVDGKIDRAALAPVFGPKSPNQIDNTFLETDLGYTIDGAARAIFERYEVNESAMCDTIRAAIETGELKRISPETRMQYPTAHRVIRAFYDRVRTADLNRWFAEAGTDYVLGATEAVGTDLGFSSRRGITRGAVMGAFTVRSDPDANIKYWTLKLSDPPKWLQSSRITSGGKRVSALWDPVKLACALLGHPPAKMSLRRLDKIMRESFPNLDDAWQEATAAERADV